MDRIDSLDAMKVTANIETIDSRRFDGILLEGAGEGDIGETLHLRGASVVEDGVVYSPSHFFAAEDSLAKAARPYIWYQSVLKQTLTADPVLHCHGLHEWAMQYWPDGASPPPSAKYQAHLPLRVSRKTINAAVERRGVSCTHVDALRYFAPAAGPLNHHGAVLRREQQLTLEQPACVHAHMDLLKMALRLQPFCDPELFHRVLDISLMARRINVAASPYDTTAYGVGVIPVETPTGRAQYRQEQTALMHRAEPVRRDMLLAYKLLIGLAFEGKDDGSPDPERTPKPNPAARLGERILSVHKLLRVLVPALQKIDCI